MPSRWRPPRPQGRDQPRRLEPSDSDRRIGIDTIVLSTSTIDAPASDVDGVLTWKAPAPSPVTSLKTGEVLVGPVSDATPEGLLANVTGVSNNAGTYTITTTPATMRSGLQRLELRFRGQPSSPGRHQLRGQGGGGQNLAPRPGVGVNLGTTFPVSGGIVSGQVSLDANVTFSAEVNSHVGIPRRGLADRLGYRHSPGRARRDP